MQSGNAQIESCQSGLDDSLSGYACRPLHIMRSARCAFRLAEMSAISWTMWNWSAHFRSRFKCWVLRLLANACMSVSHKCWHARLPASQRAAWFPSGLLSSIHKLCDTNSSDLSVWSSFAPFCTCTAVPNGLPVLAFANSKRSHCKWIPNDSKPLLAWFERMPSAPIFLYHPSTKTGVSLDGKSCTAGIDTTEPWPCPSNLALRSIDCIWFGVKAHLPHHGKHVQVAWAEDAWERVTASRWKMALRSEANRPLQS